MQGTQQQQRWHEAALPSDLARAGSIPRRLLGLLTLSRASAAFFLAMVALHVALKVGLGLRVALEDRYGFRSLVAPPQSVLLASVDVVACYVAALALGWAVPARRLRAVHAIVLAATSLLLMANFVVHGYFKSFLNYSLLLFNGAGPGELASYVGAACDAYFVAYVAAAVLTVGAYLRATRCRWSGTHRAPWLASTPLLLAAAALPVWGNFANGQIAWLVRSPFLDLVSSTFRSLTRTAWRPHADPAAPFSPPQAPLLGRYDSSLPCRPGPAPGANVLFLLIESLPMEETPLDGNARSPLGVLGELARRSVVFTSFRTVFPATSRSFMTYLCGRLPSAGSRTITKLSPSFDCDSLPKVLRRTGYRTGFFTASMFSYDNLDKSALMQSFQVTADYHDLERRARHRGVGALAVEEEVVVDSLFDFISSDRSRPFFATYFVFWTHAPYRLPFRDIASDPPYARYRQTLGYVDGVLRDVLGRLDRLGLRASTIVAVAADHGEGFGKRHESFNHAGHLFEEDVRVPLLLAVPGQVEGCRTARVGSNVDFAATILRLLGKEPPASHEGQDLLAPGYRPRPTLLFSRARFSSHGLVDGNLKYFYYVRSDEEHLYDLSIDPTEQRNLAASRPEDAESYRELTDGWILRQRARAVEELGASAGPDPTNKKRSGQGPGGGLVP